MIILLMLIVSNIFHRNTSNRHNRDNNSNTSSHNDNNDNNSNNHKLGDPCTMLGDLARISCNII